VWKIEFHRDNFFCCFIHYKILHKRSMHDLAIKKHLKTIFTANKLHATILLHFKIFVLGTVPKLSKLIF